MENWYLGLIARVEREIFHKAKPSEISRRMSAIYPNTTIFHAVICDRFWENPPKRGKQFFSVSPGRFFFKKFLWQKWIGTS